MDTITHHVPRALLARALRDAGLDPADALDVDEPPAIAGLTAAPATAWSLIFTGLPEMAAFFLRLGALADGYGGPDWIEDMIDASRATSYGSGFEISFPGYVLEG